MISGLRPRFGSASGITFNAAVAITVRGHSALTPMPSARNSSAMPSTHMLMPYFAIVYATCGANQRGFMLSGGDRFEDVRIAPGLRRLLQIRNAGLRAHECAAHVDAEHQVEALHRRFERAGQRDRAGVVHQDVDAAEMLGALLRRFGRPRSRRGCRPASAAPCRRRLRSSAPRCESCRAVSDCG